MLVFWVLPLFALVYVAWHMWTILPLAAIWKTLVIVVGVSCFLMLFLSVARKFDSLPLPLAQLSYEIGTSSIIVLLYLVILFLVLDLGDLFIWFPNRCSIITGMLLPVSSCCFLASSYTVISIIIIRYAYLWF